MQNMINVPYRIYLREWASLALILSPEQLGAHFLLVGYSWLHGPPPDDPVILARIIRCDAADLDRVLGPVKHLYKIVDGRLVDPRLEEIRAMQLNLIKRARAGGLARQEKRRRDARAKSQLKAS
jgi:uncharacterized protein YdaU (DUF1376 family)